MQQLTIPVTEMQVGDWFVGAVELGPDTRGYVTRTELSFTGHRICFNLLDESAGRYWKTMLELEDLVTVRRREPTPGTAREAAEGIAVLERMLGTL